MNPYILAFIHVCINKCVYVHDCACVRMCTLILVCESIFMPLYDYAIVYIHRVTEKHTHTHTFLFIDIYRKIYSYIHGSRSRVANNNMTWMHQAVNYIVQKTIRLQEDCIRKCLRITPSNLNIKPIRLVCRGYLLHTHCVMNCILQQEMIYQEDYLRRNEFDRGLRSMSCSNAT